MRQHFDKHPPQSEGIKLLADQVMEITSGTSFQKVRKAWDERMEGFGAIKSMTFAFRMDEYFNLTHIKLLDISSKKYVNPGKKKEDTRKALLLSITCIAVLHTAYINLNQ